MFIKNKEIDKKGKKDFSLSIFNQSKTENNYSFNHPTIKPIQLINWLIEHYSDKDDLIFDPFMGSWTTARACKDLGRNFIGCELDEKYCEIGEQRLRQEVLI